VTTLDDMTDAARVLIVEDDPELSDMLAGLLSDEGYDVAVARDGQRALHLGLTQPYDVMVLDRGLPAIEGLDLLGRLRRSGVSTPTLVLSALGNPADRVEGLDAGAEDYLSKPFDLDELLARLRALLRRHEALAESLPVPGGRLSTPTRSVLLGDGSEVALTDREAALLELLARNPSRTFTRAELLDLVFDGNGEDNLVDTYVHYLRRKLGRGVVVTVRGLGYRAGR
jgi:two-component system, OmpR family, response regulator QseB